MCWEPPEAERVFTCKYCDDDICVGDDCIELDGDYYHEDCFEECAVNILLEDYGACKHEVTSDDIDDGSDAAYEYYRDEVRNRV